MGRSEKQRACCCSTFIPDHSLHSLFVLDNKNEKVYFTQKLAMKTVFFKKSIVIKFLYFCFASCLETFVDDDSALGLMIDQLYPPWQASLTSPMQSHNNSVQDLQSHIHSLSSYLHGNYSAPAHHLSEVHHFI